MTVIQITRLNLLLLCAVCLGMGCLWAYSIFYKAYETACQQRLDAVEISKSSDTHWQSRYETEQKHRHTSEQSLFRIQSAVQRYASANAVRIFGHEPYRIEFWLTLPADPTPVPIVVEVRHLQDMPHTVYTFLSLIDFGLYDNTALQVSTVDGTVALMGGNAPDAKTRATLNRRYAELGYASAPMLVEEGSPSAPCVVHSLGIHADGPHFLLHLRPTNDFGCFGRVVEGQAILPRLYEALAAANQSARIDKARIVANDDRTGGREEL